MDKRKFLKISTAGGLATVVNAGSQWKGKTIAPNSSTFKPGFYMWTNPDHRENVKDIKARYQDLASKGIRGILFENDSPDHFKIAKDSGMQAHRWMWTMNRGEKTLLESHPEWYAVNRKGVSCAEDPPYVGYYRWLCPTKDQVKKYLLERSEEILDHDYVDGIHLDYVRFCDVILAVNLWKQYDITQQQELPEYDYCYCDDCRQAYEAEWGKDPKDFPFPGQMDSWRMFRYGKITQIVEAISTLARVKSKPISAAVFPTPEIARRLVRQDWTNWPLDAVFPMLYHGFYQEPPKWIGLAAQDGLRVLQGKFPMYAGIYLPDFNNSAEIETGIRSALESGVRGVSIFGRVEDQVLTLVDRYKDRFG